LASWIGAHLRAFAFCQGVTMPIVPDNTKTGVTKACGYDPDLKELALDYGNRPLQRRLPNSTSGQHVGGPYRLSGESPKLSGTENTIT
jgi:hypothetical protein